MRILIVYDCLFPYTVGGGERWLGNVARRLAAEGHDVSYLTLRQWDRGTPPEVPGVRVVAAGPGLALYVDGRRRILPPLVFGAGVLRHLLRHGRRYDVVHTAAFPYFALLAAALARPLHRYALVAEWYEVWTRAYWKSYLGRAGGTVGHAIQRLCARVPQRAVCFSRMHASRLRAEGARGEVALLAGMFDAPRPVASPSSPPLVGAGVSSRRLAGADGSSRRLAGADGRSHSLAGAGGSSRPPAGPGEVVFAGRHIPEKRVAALVPALVAARERVPGLRAAIFGDGPQRPEVLARIAAAGAADWLRAPGFVASEELDAALRAALCMVLPSAREGYGLIVVEAASAGVPSVVVAGPDNAAVELVEEGVNGTVAPSASPQDLADAIVRIVDAGPVLRASTAAWFHANAERLSLERSLRSIVDLYSTGLPSTRA